MTLRLSSIRKRIGRYRIEKILGKGGFGLVYLAHDEQLDRLVAIKVPHAKLISKPEDAEAYLTEARTVANLDHPGIVPVHRCRQHGRLSLLRRLEVHRGNRSLDEAQSSIG